MRVTRPLWLLLLLSGAPVFGQNPASPGKTTAAPAAAPAKKDHALSQKTSSALSAGITYLPPATPPPAEVDEPDIPRNEIIRLPRHVVRERPTIFSDRDLYTKENLAKLAARRYLNPGAQKFFTPFRVGNLDEEYALMLYEADERKRAMADYEDKARLYQQTGDEVAAAALKDDARRTFMRRTSSGTRSDVPIPAAGSFWKVTPAP